MLQDRASSGSTFGGAVPVEVRWQQGHSLSLGAQGESPVLVGTVPAVL